MPAKIQVAISFDTTGSMYPCLAEVRRVVDGLLKRLFNDIPGLEVGLIAHGDYCDRGSTYVTKKHLLSSDRGSLSRFVRTVGPTGGGDYPECYELVLHEARDFGWSDDAKKILVMIGDATPHPTSYRENTERLDWRNEAQLLGKVGVDQIIAVQAMGNRGSDAFWSELAAIGNGFRLTLDQFNQVAPLIIGICYGQQDMIQLRNYRDELDRTGQLGRTLEQDFAIILGERVTKSRYATVAKGLVPVPRNRFQILNVTTEDIPAGEKKIGSRDFIIARGLRFQKGRVFYRFKKRETIQEGKEAVLVHRASGDMFTGAEARKLIGVELGTRATIRPDMVPAEYDAYVQSTSVNRAFESGDVVMYDITDLLDS